MIGAALLLAHRASASRLHVACFCNGSSPILPGAYSPGLERYSPNMLPREDVFLCVMG
jgi:hypothetical protein